MQGRIHNACIVLFLLFFLGPIQFSSIALSIGHTGRNDDEFYKGLLDEVNI